VLRKIAVISVLLVACLTSTGMAAEGPYFGANLGMSATSDSDISEGGFSGEISYDNGYAFGAALGYSFGVGRMEGELGYKTADIDKVSVNGLGSASVNGDISALSFMINGYVDINAAPAVKPYIMAGIGMANVSLDSNDLDVDDSDTVFAYQAGVGVGFALNDKVTLDLSYRYLGTSDPEIDGVDVEYGSHNFLAGIRVKF